MFLVALFSALTVVDTSQSCLPQSALSLQGIVLGSRDSAIHSLGSPIGQFVDSSEDDGGKFVITRLNYPHLNVESGRGIVQRLVTSSHLVEGPKGVRVGMTLREVGRRLSNRNLA